MTEDAEFHRRLDQPPNQSYILVSFWDASFEARIDIPIHSTPSSLEFLKKLAEIDGACTNAIFPRGFYTPSKELVKSAKKIKKNVMVVLKYLRSKSQEVGDPRCYRKPDGYQEATTQLGLRVKDLESMKSANLSLIKSPHTTGAFYMTELAKAGITHYCEMSFD